MGDDRRAVPSFAFALYPGGFGARRCPTNHADQTEVHIFFGEKDDVGNAGEFRSEVQHLPTLR